MQNDKRNNEIHGKKKEINGYLLFSQSPDSYRVTTNLYKSRLLSCF